ERRSRRVLRGDALELVEIGEARLRAVVEEDEQGVVPAPYAPDIGLPFARTGEVVHERNEQRPRFGRGGRRLEGLEPRKAPALAAQQAVGAPRGSGAEAGQELQHAQRGDLVAQDYRPARDRTHGVTSN